MVALQEAVELELSEMGFRIEGRRYVPHLTLGREEDQLVGRLMVMAL